MTIQQLDELNEMYRSIKYLKEVVEEYESNPYPFYIVGYDEECNTYDHIYEIDIQLKNQILDILKKRLEQARKEFEEIKV